MSGLRRSMVIFTSSAVSSSPQCEADRQSWGEYREACLTSVSPLATS